MARFSVDIDDESFTRLVEQARRKGVTIHETAAELLKAALAAEEPTTVELTVAGGEVRDARVG